MRKLFVIVMGIVLGLLILVIRELEKDSGQQYIGGYKENILMVILLVFTFGTSILLSWQHFRHRNRYPAKRKK